MAILDMLKKCVICGRVQVSYSDMLLFLEDKRVYRVCCKCGKHATGSDLEVVVNEWDRISQLDMEEYENG